MCLTEITLATGASVIGRLHSQTAVTMDYCTVIQPTPPDITPPNVSYKAPFNLATGAATNGNITATFDEWMNPLTITTATFTLAQGATPVPATVTYLGTVATLNPNSNLLANTSYTATITMGAKDLAGNAIATNHIWNFTTGAGTAAGPVPINLGTAGNFAIVAKAGVTSIPTCNITGDIGVSPIAATGATGFALTMDSTGAFSSSSQVIGKVYAADYIESTSAKMTIAVGSMEAAYVEAAGRPTPDFIELGGGDISGLTLVPGLYKWSTGVLINMNVTLDGGPNDVWIFQISGGITQAAGTTVTLTGGAQAKNVFWQAFGAVALNTTSHLEGIVLSETEITLATGASVNGRLLSQTAVTLDQNTITQPTP